MLISVVNVTRGKITDADGQTVLRAVNRQIAEDFEPYWGFGARLRLEGASNLKPSARSSLDLRGDAILYLWDGADVDGALGYHDKNARGIPYGFVFTKLAAQLHEKWSTILSHEALELLGDSMSNLLVQGPHPADLDKRRPRRVFHWYEMCDAVQNESYVIDSVAVSNFVLPLYFTGGEEVGGRNDFLDQAHRGHTLRSFGTNPGGYVGFFDPVKNDWDSYSARGDRRAAKRMKIKDAVPIGRSHMRKASDAAPPLISKLPPRRTR